MLVQALESRDL